ncbi:hypothetical protein GGH98_004076, partial [Coemansia sp. RSA 454]
FPRVNYPQSRTTPEYEIKYVLKAKLLNSRDAHTSTILSMSQPIMYVPETVAPLLPVSAEHGDTLARFAFCDNVGDGQGGYHMRATGLQQAFRPGDAVDLQLRITGQRTLRKVQFAVIEQTDCFYPQIPEPREEQLDIGRRLWSSQRVLSDTADLPFERDSCVVPDICSDHTTSKRSRSGSTYHAHLHTRLPNDVLVLHETGYLRYTYFVQLYLFSGSGAWGSHSQTTHTRIPIPVASRILPEDSQPGSARTPYAEPHMCNGGSRRGSSAAVPQSSSEFSRRAHSSSSAWSEVNSLEISDYADKDMLKQGRSIADLGARLQQFIPRRLPSTSGLNNRRRHDTHVGRAVSHGRMSDHQPLWNMVDLPPMPAVPAVAGIYAAANASQVSLFSSPLARGPSLSFNSSDEPSLYNQTSGDRSLTGTEASSGRFSLTFLLKLREFYHDDASSLALSRLISGHDTDIIPSAMHRPPAVPDSSGISRLGLGNMRSGHKSREFSLGLNSSSMSVCSGRQRSSSRMSMQSVSSVLVSNDRVLPQLEAVMISFRDPTTNHVTTWSAFSSGRPESNYRSESNYRPVSTKDQSTRYSRLSSMSISSNDTACASHGCLSLSKDVPPVPSIHTLSIDGYVHIS